ncbi:MAG: hypothetical protein JJT94_16200 [Bernardetiaceae bacterium]|nr:hypothetical protein [Bernardetiaceae bacterium]
MYNLKNTFAFFILFFACIHSPIYAQDSPLFKLTKRSRPEECGAKGCYFEGGFVRSNTENRQVVVALFVQHYTGYWERKEFVRQGRGYLEIGLKSCDFTGNFYAFACYADDASCKFPSSQEVEKQHEEKDQAPRFKVLTIEDKNCDSEGGVLIKNGYVYSPKGLKVEITLFLERKEGDWRRKSFFYYGTGLIDLDIEGCDLTGNYKSAIRYLEQEE